jgi:predicted nucleic acid-binding protein
MVNAVFDTNILIDYLLGIEAAKTELDRYEKRAISIVTWMEVMAGATPESESVIRDWLSTFEVLPLDPMVADRAVSIRKQMRIRLPEAIVFASAQLNNALLVTRNTKDFPPDDPGVRLPYQG